MIDETTQERGIFVRDDEKPTSALMVLLLCLPLCLAGQWNWACASLLVTFFLAMRAASQGLKDEEKQEIRFDVVVAEDVLVEMLDWESLLRRMRSSCPVDSPEVDNHRHKARLVLSLGLTALARKYGKRRKGEFHDDLALVCQQGAYIGFRVFPDDDTIVGASVSLLALVAKDERVRERFLSSIDDFCLDLPIQCLRNALQRAKEICDEADETMSAELQRKGCLLLGSVASSSDEGSNMSSLVVQRGGLEVILDALAWYRYHADVANWALWAVFTLCYENYSNKIALVQAHGIELVIQVMRNCSDCVEVARHGTAILFDLLREDDDRPSHGKLGVWKMRKLALDSGLHELLLHVMEQYQTEMDIMMMSQEMLAGTDYHGEIHRNNTLQRH